MDPSLMKLALAEAELAGNRGEVPVGAVLMGPGGQLLSSAGNRVEGDCDPTAHAEMLVIREAARRFGSPRLPGCDLYVTLEPCPMCAAAISAARIRRLVFGAYDPKSGGVEHGPRLYTQAVIHHKPEVIGGVGETAAAAMLRAFFAARRGPPADPSSAPPDTSLAGT